MEQTARLNPNRILILLNRFRTFASKPQNSILLLLGLILTVSTIAPMISILVDTVSVHLGSVDAHYTGLTEGYTLYNWQDLVVRADEPDQSMDSTAQLHPAVRILLPVFYHVRRHLSRIW